MFGADGRPEQRFGLSALIYRFDAPRWAPDFPSDVLRAGLHSDFHAKPLILYSDLVACGVRMDTDFATLSSAS